MYNCFSMATRTFNREYADVGVVAADLRVSRVLLAKRVSRVLLAKSSN